MATESQLKYWATLKGKIPWNKGLKGFRKGWRHTEEYKIMMREIAIGRKMPEVSNENHHNWKGDKVGYRALHSWIERKLGKPDHCEHCGKLKTTPKSIHWANISGDYKRDLTDWISLCVKCHKKYDGYGVEN